ncbi:MAG: cytoplasmic protein [Selenomonadaceae bacterium]|nr:cytoplasmic protein [Selenomonadaceae bacterium]
MGLTSHAKILALHRKLSTYDAHEKSFNNFDAIQKSQKCGCFFCERIFPAGEVEDWTSDNTAFCPYFGMDSVVQDYNVKVTSHFLRRMNAEWFGNFVRQQR